MPIKSVKVDDTRLSYSSANLIMNCPRKYYHYKIAKTPIDPDADKDTQAFKIGKAFHRVLELSSHDLGLNLKPFLDQAFEEEQLVFEVDAPLILAMLKRYRELQAVVPLKLLSAEMEVSDKKFIGYIDAVMQSDDESWWIVDLKTASTFMQTTAARLTTDFQLNLYAYMMPTIAKVLELDPTKFGGCRYRVTTKSKLKRGVSEAFKDYSNRIYANVKSFDIPIPVSEMNIQDARSLFADLHKLKTGWIKRGLLPKKNYSYCETYFKPCEYYSQCHSKTYTELSADAMTRMRGV